MSLIQTVTDSLENAKQLRLAEEAYYSRTKVLLDFLGGCKNNPTDRIGKNVISHKFWEVLPLEYRPKSGDSYDVIYTIKNSLLDIIKEQDENLDQMSTMNKKLPELIFDLECILNQTTSVLNKDVHSGWWDIGLNPGGATSSVVYKRWGDLSSSSEDEKLVKSLNSLIGTKAETAPGIDLPGDFDTIFPDLFDRLTRFTVHYGWEINLKPEVLLRSQGLIQFTRNQDDEFDTKNLSAEAKLALVSLYSSVACLFIQPNSLVGEKETEVAVTYACSIIAREKLSKNNKEYLKIALKSGDGGKATLLGRFYYLTKTGSSAIRLVFEAIEKCLTKFARELPDDQLTQEVITDVTTRAFTSTDGMLENSYRISTVETTEYVNRLDKRGKTVKEEKKVRKPRKVVPDLTVAQVPLKPSELTKVNAIRDAFNNRKAEIEKRLNKVDKPSMFDKPKICQEVVLEAYNKLQGYKQILKERNLQIRQEATKLNDGKKPSPGNWAAAKAEVLKKTDDIPDSVLDMIKW